MNTPIFQSQWQKEDWINSRNTYESVEKIFSKKYQTKMLNTAGSRSLLAQLDAGIKEPVARLSCGRYQDQEFFKSYAEQQQQAFGFPYGGAGISTPATVTWLSQAYDNTATYPAGSGGNPVAGSFIQLSGVVYAIPAAVASTPGTPPPGGVFVIQPPATGGNSWNVNPQPRLSAYANPVGFFPTPPVFTDVVDSYWFPPDLQVCSTTAAQYYIPAPGRGPLVSASATTFSTLQVNIATVWTTVFTFTGTTFIWVELDGMSWRVLNSGTTRNTYTVYRVRQSVQT